MQSLELNITTLVQEVCRRSPRMSCRGLRPASIEAVLMRRMNKVCTWLDTPKENKHYAEKLNKQEAEIEKLQNMVSILDIFR